MVSCGFKLILAADSRMTSNTDTATVKFQKSQPVAIPPSSALGLTLSTAPAVLYHPAPRCPAVSERTCPLDRNGPDVGRIRIHSGSSSIPQRLAGACPQRPVPRRHEQFPIRKGSPSQIVARASGQCTGRPNGCLHLAASGPARLPTSLGRDATAFSSREGDRLVRQSARQQGRNGSLPGTPRQGLTPDRARGSLSSDHNAT